MICDPSTSHKPTYSVYNNLSRHEQLKKHHENAQHVQIQKKNLPYSFVFDRELDANRAEDAHLWYTDHLTLSFVISYSLPDPCVLQSALDEKPTGLEVQGISDRLEPLPFHLQRPRRFSSHTGILPEPLGEFPLLLNVLGRVSTSLYLPHTGMDRVKSS